MKGRWRGRFRDAIPKAREARATRPQVFALNGADRLGKARVLSFATNGLLAGEILGLIQPGLVLTSPAQATEQNDGPLYLGSARTCTWGAREPGAGWRVGC